MLPRGRQHAQRSSKQASDLLEQRRERAKKIYAIYVVLFDLSKYKHIRDIHAGHNFVRKR